MTEDQTIITPLDSLKAKFILFELTPEDERVQILGVQAARLIAEGKASIENLFMPLALLYQQMGKRGEITTLSFIGRDKALAYWTRACLIQPGSAKYVRIWITQALYIYDLITEKL